MDFDTIVKEQREELERIEATENIIPRENTTVAENALKFPNVLAILGIRRCGKSVFSHLLAKAKNYGYANFDDERLLGVKTEDLNELLKSFYKLYGDVEIIVLDEIQNVRGWELFVNRLRRTKKVILTGSNSHLLSGELATHLTGRHIDVVLHPFSFREFLKFKKFKTATAYTTKEKAALLRLLEEYLQVGGFPEVQKFGKQIVSVIYEDVLTKDIILRHKIKKMEEIRKLAKYCINNTGQEFSYSKTAKVLGVRHVSTVSKWANYLEEAFLIFKLERFSYKLKQQFLAPKKVYCTDSGIINTIDFKFSENKGKIMENLVAIELKKRNNQEIYYWKDYLQHEVDFVIKKGNKIQQLIQVSYANSHDDVKEREITALLKASKALKCKKLLLITWDYEAKEKTKNLEIQYTPLWKWLNESCGFEYHIQH
ncbi:MAG: ATP-binding protein [Candidatus Aenigmarchaeota archaeon]|nr:ATP-binding protein [Candidatus Aenigmarchaeota archaeon]